MAVSEHTLTELLQHSGRVLPNTTRGEVVLHRRDGEDLVLMTRGHSAALGTALRALIEIVMGGPERVETVLPWMAFLSPADREACLREVCEVARAAVATGQLSHLETLLYQWEATGLAAWDERRLCEREGAERRTSKAPLSPAARTRRRPGGRGRR